jgi:hypothetical protein
MAQKKVSEVKWECFPARSHPGRTIGASIFILSFLVLVYFIYGFWWTCFAILIFFLTLNSYFIPQRYRLNSDGVRVDHIIYRSERPWQEFRNFYPTKNGVVLSTFRRRNFLDNFRGLHLLLPEDRKPILEFIEHQIKGPSPKSKRRSKHLTNPRSIK